LENNDFAQSKDETIHIANDLANNHPRIIPVSKIKEGMMGWDMIQGMNSCNGKYICVIDGDGQFPIESVVDVYRTIKATGYDMVKTYRNKLYDGLYRHLLSSTGTK
jgi:glycosyltransferase involved in cell wall biosynthesis